MSIVPNIRVNVGVPFPALVTGGSGIGVTKTNGVWTVALISGQLVSIMQSAGYQPSYAGTGVVNFSAFPGGTSASLVITGQTGIVSGSAVTAWLAATATADHSADEHWVDGPTITAGNIVAGVGFTIYATPRPDNQRGKYAGWAWGRWSVAWRWQ